MFSKVCAQIDELFDEHLGVLVDVCNIESPTDDKSGVDAVGDYFVNIANKHGWQVERHREVRCGDAIAITMNPDVDKAPVVFSAHMDTVHPKGLFGYPPTRVEDGRVMGPGVCDCKGGAVASLLAMSALERAGFGGRPIKLILQSDEEVSSLYSEGRTVNFMAECAKGAVAFLNTEPCKGGVLTIERKGIIRYIFDIKGMAMHSSLCFAGASAIAEAAHKIIELERWKTPEGITCNCGTIEGGTVANTVPEHCRFVADIRYSTDEEFAEVERRVREIAEHSYVEGTECTLTVKSQRVSMPRYERNVALSEKIRKIFERAGLPPMEFVKSKGGSDASNISRYGIPTIDSIGLCGAYIHSPKEYAFVESLGDSARMLAAIAFYI